MLVASSSCIRSKTRTWPLCPPYTDDDATTRPPSLEMATLRPKRSRSFSPGRVSPTWVHTLLPSKRATRTSPRKTLPSPPDAAGDPTTKVVPSPLRAMEKPNWSPALLPNSGCPNKLQLPSVGSFWYTTTIPRLISLPIRALGAETASRRPSSDRDVTQPKRPAGAGAGRVNTSVQFPPSSFRFSNRTCPARAFSDSSDTTNRSPCRLTVLPFDDDATGPPNGSIEGKRYTPTELPILMAMRSFQTTKRSPRLVASP